MDSRSSSTSYGDLVARTWNRKVLFSALFELTYSCNLDCFICYNDRKQRGRRMSVTDYQRVFEQLASLGTLHVALSGGEPLSHPSFFEIARRARAMDFVIRVKTNGMALRGELIHRMREEVRPYLLEVSLHGARAGTHDRQTRIAGSFVRTIENLRAMVAAGLRVQLNAPITRWNASESAEMSRLAGELGCALRFDTEISPRDDGDTTPMDIAPTPDQVLEVAEVELGAARAAALPAQGEPGRAATTEHHCGAGSAVIAIDPYGTIYPCVQWRHAIGNVHRDSVADLWNGTAFDEIRSTTRAIKALPTARTTPFCPGQARTISGDPHRIYDSAVMRADSRARVRLRVIRDS